MARSPMCPPKDVVREHYRRVAGSLTFRKTSLGLDADQGGISRCVGYLGQPQTYGRVHAFHSLSPEEYGRRAALPSSDR